VAKFKLGWSTRQLENCKSAGFYGREGSRVRNACKNAGISDCFTRNGQFDGGKDVLLQELFAKPTIGRPKAAQLQEFSI
jgi:hypothetical protein